MAPTIAAVELLSAPPDSGSRKPEAPLHQVDTALGPDQTLIKSLIIIAGRATQPEPEPQPQSAVDELHVCKLLGARLRLR